ncbi:MAG: hypothetical protein A2Y97_01195 [Nitrospirae bacterium RBG_13_39_12]|nr:MAG: hypothetical protein A2Y97_01195 [Nitrospirae bacterium RBG_13_39_12]
MEHLTKEIEVLEKNGVFIVPAELEEDFILTPTPQGRMNLLFWDESCLNRFLESYGFVPVILHKN